MSKCSARLGKSQPHGSSAWGARIFLSSTRHRRAAVLVSLILLIQPACLFKKHKTAAPAPQVTPTIVRIVFLPLNIANENNDLRWLSLAVPIMMAKVSESAADLEPIPMWEVMPVAVEAAGTSRIITTEVAAYIASRLTAKWASEGELSPAKGGVHMTLDFIPAKTTLVPFRYEKETSVDSLGGHFPEAFEQFLRYLVARPMPRGENRSIKFDSIKEVAEALDREYGWFVTADPGKSSKIVEELAGTDSRLARLLFNPNLYPGMGTPVAEPKASKPPAPTASNDNEKQAEPNPGDRSQTPAVSAAAKSRDAQGTAAPIPPAPAQTAPPAKPEELNQTATKAAPEVSPAAQPAPVAAFIPPPPRSFTQKLESIALSSAGRENPPAAKPGTSRVQRASAPSAPQSAKEKAGEKPVPRAMNKASPASRDQNFKIQVGSSRSKEEAAEIAARLTKAGFTPEVVLVDLKEKGGWYRIRLQGYESRTAAEAAGKKLLDSKLISQYWLIP